MALGKDDSAVYINEDTVTEISSYDNNVIIISRQTIMGREQRTKRSVNYYPLKIYCGIIL